MKSSQEVYEEILGALQEMERIPPEVHLFCPRTSDDDLDDYEEAPDDGDGGSTQGPDGARQALIDDGRRRLQLTSWASLILGIGREQADRWLGTWVQRTETFLVKCDPCIRAWHMERKALKGRLLKWVSPPLFCHCVSRAFGVLTGRDFNEETANIMEGRLQQFDTERISRGLQKAVGLLQTHGPMSSAKLVALDSAAVLAFYEALCCVEYLAVPEHRQLFDYVFHKTQEKRPLKVASAVIPSMTVFLFEADTLRRAFARTAWQRRPAQSLTPAQFDWAVSDHLARAIEAVSMPDAPDADVVRFWDGFLLLLNAMGERFVLHSLRGMQIPLDVYQLAVRHLERPSDDVLAQVMRALCALMDKSAKAFWDALSLMNPPQLPMFVCASPAFAPFLARSFEPAMQLVPESAPPATTPATAAQNAARVPLLVAFVRSLMRSLNRNQRADVCDYFLTVFLTSGAAPAVTATREGHSTCIAAGLNALHMTLVGYLDTRYRLTAESALFVTTVINNTVKHHDYVVRSGNLHPGDRYNIGLSQAAVGVIEAALALDTRAIHDEWMVLQQQGQQSQTARLPPGGSERRSSQLWDGFRTSLGAARLDIARVMLAATLALRGIQRFAPKKRQLVVEDAARRRFNDELDPAAEAIAATITRISEALSRADLQKLLAGDPPSVSSPPPLATTRSRTMDAVAATLVHAEDAIREAGVQLLCTLVDEDSRSDAIAAMVSRYPASFLVSFADAVSYLTGGDDVLRKQHQQQQHQTTTTAPPAPPATATPYEPMRQIFRCSNDILAALSDTATGLLRSRTLTPDEQRAVKRWWTMVWQFVDHAFLRARAWSEDVDKTAMENFCRDVMEFAERLMDQDGLFASALCNSTAAETTGSPADASMQDVLDAPRKYSMGFFEMIQLRDPYLVGIIVQILVKLFNRLKEHSMNFPDAFVQSIRRTYTPHGQVRNKFAINTNMNDTQRAELMRAIGDTDDDEHDDRGGIEIISWTKAGGSGVPKKKQTTIEAWSRAGAGMATTPTSKLPASPAVPSSLTSKDAASQLTPTLNKHRALLDKMKATAATKPDQKALLANRAAIKEARARDKAEMDKHKAEAIARARAMRGGPAAPLKSDIMVDSEEEDDDDDDDDDGDDGVTALIQQSKKGEQKLDDAERRLRANMQQMAARLPVKKIKLQRSAKDMRARIVPSMERLHQAILEWDIFHEGNDPPNSRPCEAVADAYPSPAEYKRTFFPLLISEAWRSFVTAKDESTAKPFGIKVITRISVDNFLEVSTAMTTPNNASNNGGSGGNNGWNNERVGEGDIVLLSQGQDPLADRAQAHCLARIWKVSYKRNAIEVTYRLNSRGNQMLPVLLPGAEFRALKITNMTTIEREFAALESMQFYDLMDEVLKATPSPMLTFGDAAVADMARNYELNRAQALAILHGKANDGFTLVQGPPGTGKTKTIVAMVGALLTGTIKASHAGAAVMSRPGQSGGSSSGGGGGDTTNKKLLVCAPSNAAVDELVLRLKAGVKETTGATRKINVLRLGRSDVINAGVLDVTLDELVKAEIERQTSSAIGKPGAPGAPGATGPGGSGATRGTGPGGTGPSGSMSDREKLHQRAGEIKAKLAELMPALEAARCSETPDHTETNQLQREVDTLRSEQRRLGAQIERDKESGNTYAREAEIKRRQVQQKILSEAHVLCATLSGSGHDVFKSLNVEFETVIIDEAAQCVELSALIPLKYGCAKCVLVGDPKQLPPTVLSQSAARYGYDQSLFVRMQRNRPQDVHLLDTQYRMHPEISRFPSREFYEGRLIDGADMARLRHEAWHDVGGGGSSSDGSKALLGPYRFFDVEGVQARGSRGQSLVNDNEVRVALQLYRTFVEVAARTNAGNNPRKVGIITPYKAQLYALRQRFADSLGADILKAVEFNTTDAFQGRECDVIIFSCVRASPTGGIGFMTDIRRMNVGLTRARSSLWILGDSRALRQGEFWRALIEDAKDRRRYTSGHVLAQLKAVAGGGGGRGVTAAAAAVAAAAAPSRSSRGPGDGPKKALPPPPPPPKAASSASDDDSYSPPPAAPPAVTPRNPPAMPSSSSNTYTVVDRPAAAGHKRPHDSSPTDAQPTKRVGLLLLPLCLHLPF